MAKKSRESRVESPEPEKPQMDLSTTNETPAAPDETKAVVDETKEPRLVIMERPACPLCQLPMTAYSTRPLITHYKCKGFDGQPGCGHTMSVTRQRVG